MADVVTTRLNRSAFGGATFGQVFELTMSDGSAFTSPIQLSVSAGNALTGFEPSAAFGGTSPGWIPDGTQVRVTPFTTSADDQTPGLGAATVDVASYIKDTADPSNTSMKLNIYVTASTVFKVIVECLQ